MNNHPDYSFSALYLLKELVSCSEFALSHLLPVVSLLGTWKPIMSISTFWRNGPGYWHHGSGPRFCIYRGDQVWGPQWGSGLVSRLVSSGLVLSSVGVCVMRNQSAG